MMQKIRQRLGKEARRKIMIIAALLIVLSFLFAMCERKEAKKEEEAVMSIREPAVAGQFYPATDAELKSAIALYLSEAKKEQIENIRGIVVPHAGYVYSGPVAASAYMQIKGKNYDTVIILGPSHRYRLEGAALPEFTHYKTPLGLVEVSPKVNKLKNKNLFVSIEGVHQNEHSIEVQIPFLQESLGNNFKIIPLVLGDADPKELASALESLIDEKTLVVASSDLSHYKEYKVANDIDSNCKEAIPNLDFEKINFCEACGIVPILTLMYIAKDKGWEGKLIDYRNSGDTAGSKDSVVGYSAIAFYGNAQAAGLAEGDKKILLSLARETVELYVKEGKMPDVDESKFSSSLKEKKGCFVTLNKNGQLRGCIGHIIPQEELYKCVIENAVNAASNDMRFNPVEASELNEIEVEISVLSVPGQLIFQGYEDLLNKLTPLKDGVVLKAGFHQSTYLPQVWEQLPEKENFLSSLCVKGGSSPECWKDQSTEVYTYQADVFSEEKKQQ